MLASGVFKIALITQFAQVTGVAFECQIMQAFEQCVAADVTRIQECIKAYPKSCPSQPPPPPFPPFPSAPNECTDKTVTANDQMKAIWACGADSDTTSPCVHYNRINWDTTPYFNQTDYYVDQTGQAWQQVPSSAWPLAQRRIFQVVTPLGSSEEPLPVLVYFMFQSASGIADGWHSASKGGIMSWQDLQVTDDKYGRRSLQRMLVGAVQQGFAVVLLSEYTADPEATLHIGIDSYAAFKCNSVPGEDDSCWNKGLNYDKPYIQEVVGQLKTIGQAQLDLSKVVLFGYSIGAEMVSRMFNNWQTMVTGTRIIGGIMVGGGSYFSYSPDACTAAGGTYIADPAQPDSGGCKGVSEERYDDGTYAFSQHPPVLLLSNSGDPVIGNREIPTYYYDVLDSKKVAVMNVEGNAVRHGTCFNQIDFVLTFLVSVIKM